MAKSPQKAQQVTPSQDSIKETSSLVLRALNHIALPVLAGILLVSSPSMTAIVLVALLPTIILYVYYIRATSPQSRIPLSKLVTIYLVTGVLGTALVIAYSSGLSYLLGMLLFGDDLESYMTEFYRLEKDVVNAKPSLIAKRAEMAAAPEYWAFLVIMSFDIIAFSEELLKYIALPVSLHFLTRSTSASALPGEISEQDAAVDEEAEEEGSLRDDPTQSLLGQSKLEEAYIPILVAATLGFSTMENIGYIYGAVVSEAEPPLRLLQTVLERLVLSTPGHMFSALYIGVMAIVRDFRSGTNHRASHSSDVVSGSRVSRAVNQITGWLRILAVPIMFHGLFDFVLLGVSAWQGNIGWVHPRSGTPLWLGVGGVLGLSMTLALLVRRNWVRYGISIG